MPEGICFAVFFALFFSEADSFRHMEIKIYYTPEDVHVV
jgi:hypothetical protein